VGGGAGLPGEVFGCPLVATHDIHYINPEQACLQRLATAIRLNQRLHDLPNPKRLR